MCYAESFSKCIQYFWFENLLEKGFLERFLVLAKFSDRVKTVSLETSSWLFRR